MDVRVLYSRGMNELTPLMRQYWEVKNSHLDKIIFFRMGDFFELFYEDATLAAPLLGLTLTQRNKKSNDETPMCGMPHHSVANYINKLLGYGHRVAICDQLEDPKLAKGIVKRGITRILTPGMVFDPESLDGSKSNFIACYDNQVLALADPTTGEAFYLTQISIDKLKQIIPWYPIVEWVQISSVKVELELPLAPSQLNVNLEQWVANVGKAWVIYPRAVQGLHCYLQSLVSQSNELIVQDYELRSVQTRMRINPQIIRHLEIFETNKGEKKGSFFNAIDRTQSSLGSRMLREWLSFPLTEEKEILRRQFLIKNWMSDLSRLNELKNLLRSVGDVERRLARVAQANSTARDLQQLRVSLNYGCQIVHLTRGQMIESFQALERLTHKLESTLVEAPPLVTRSGGMIQKGINAQLDEWMSLSTDVQQLLLELEQREKQKTGISSLKIRYNQVFGYYIEVTHTHKDKIPKHYLRKQTLVQAERFSTEELVELEKKVLAAESKRADLEFVIFEELRTEVLTFKAQILALAHLVAEVDVCSAAARLAMEADYHFAEIAAEGSALELLACRHPVVEQSLQKFTPNDILIQKGQILLVTGPNMAGKSTLMRQVALNVWLAQIGFPVACRSAHIPIIKGIFTRIGASDQLSEGLSTFMVEMQETAFIIKHANAQSLVVLDEIGRGTSTGDGLSLAQAILEYLLNKVGSYGLFATHYHELTALEAKFLDRLLNIHMAIQENGADISFLHTLKKGPAEKSYGVHVAKLAGLPDSILKRSQHIMSQFEVSNLQKKQMSLFDSFNVDPEIVEVTREVLPLWVQDIENLDINNLTPILALQYLVILKERALGHHSQGPLSNLTN